MRYNREKKELTFDEAKDKALRLLEFRSHSERELSDKLKRAGAKEEDIDEILEFCRNYGFLDDRKYAIAKAKDLKNLFLGLLKLSLHKEFLLFKMLILLLLWIMEKSMA